MAQRELISADAVLWQCVCKSEQRTDNPDLKIEGGCHGHPDGGYCYCGPETAEFDDQCSNCSALVRVQLRD